MRVREAGFAATEGSGGVVENLAIEKTRYDKVTFHPSWNGSTDSDLSTAAHPNLGAVTLTLTGPAGTLSSTRRPSPRRGHAARAGRHRDHPPAAR